MVLNILNSSDVNCFPLSETNVSTKPFLQNYYRNADIVNDDVMSFVLKTSNNLEYEQTTTIK